MGGLVCVGAIGVRHATTEHLELIDNDDQLRSRFVVLHPAFLLKPTFDEHLGPFAEVLAGDLRLATPKREVDEVGDIDPLLALLAAVVRSLTRR